MKKHIVLALVLALPALLLGIVTETQSPSTGPGSRHVEPVGGQDYFFCATFQIIKYAGMIMGRPDAVLVGAIGSGVACAYGW